MSGAHAAQLRQDPEEGAAVRGQPPVRIAVNLQPDARDPSKAKKRQVEQLLALHDELGMSEER